MIQVNVYSTILTLTEEATYSKKQIFCKTEILVINVFVSPWDGGEKELLQCRICWSKTGNPIEHFLLTHTECKRRKQRRKSWFTGTNNSHEDI